jgi:hypothetical protein
MPGALQRSIGPRLGRPRWTVLQGRPLGRRPTLQHSIRDPCPQQGQSTAVNAFLADDVFPARSTAFTVNVLSPCTVA